jgi:transposase
MEIESRTQPVTRSRHAQHDVAVRVWIVVWLARGHASSRVASLVGCSDGVVRKWRARWEAWPTIESLSDAPRSGRPPRVSLETRCEIVQLACERPADNRVVSRDVRHEFEYRGRGTCSLLAAFDIRTGKVFGRVVRHRDARAPSELVHRWSRPVHDETGRCRPGAVIAMRSATHWCRQPVF